MRDVAEYNGIKYSLQPHGLKSRLLVAFFAFVAAFGGALLAATPAYADDPEVGKCYVGVAVTPMPTETGLPTTTITPTACPVSPSPPVTTIITQTVNVPGPTVTVVETKTKTVYVDHTVTMPGETVTVTTTPSPVTSEIPVPSRTPDPPVLPIANSMSAGSLAPWGIGVVGVLGTALAVVGVTGIARRRRYQGRHLSEDEGEDGYGVGDYSPANGDYDPVLGGYAGKTTQVDGTAEIPRVKDDLTTTSQIPVVE